VPEASRYYGVLKTRPMSGGRGRGGSGRTFNPDVPAKKAGLHNVKLSAEYKAELLRKALDSTDRAMVETVDLDAKVRRLEEAKNWNNWISYLWELADLAGVSEIARYENRREQLPSAFDLVKEVYEDGSDSISGLDSLTKACELLGRSDEAANIESG
jgi:hypothetical protein